MKKGGYFTLFRMALFLLIMSVSSSGAYAQKAAVSTQATLDNLMTAYNNESNANIRYLAFAKKADIEGYDVAASLFRAVALAEQVHCERYFELIEKLGGTPNAVIESPVVKSTRDNLRSAFKAEAYKKNVIYPEFLRQAEAEGAGDAAKAFKNSRATSGIYADLYSSMFNNMSLSKGLAKDFYVCPVCGNIMDAVTVSKCPICSADTNRFKRVR